MKIEFCEYNYGRVGANVVADLNKLGAEGWDVVPINLFHLGLLLKREIPEPPTKPMTVVERRVMDAEGRVRIEGPEPPPDAEFEERAVRAAAKLFEGIEQDLASAPPANGR